MRSPSGHAFDTPFAFRSFAPFAIRNGSAKKARKNVSSRWPWPACARDRSSAEAPSLIISTMSPQSYWWAATTCLLLGLALSSQSALSVKLTPDDQLSPDPFVDESPDQPPAIPSSSPPPAEGEGVVRGQFESGRTGGPASPRVNVFEQRKAALERVERTLAERHRALQLALAAATTGKRKVALVVDDPDGNLHAIGAAREHVQGAIRIAETSAESTSEEGATLSPAVVKAHQRNLTLRLVELERSRKHFGEELRKSERRQLARDVDRLSKDVGSRALHVINEKMDTVRKNVSRLIHDMEIDMEKRFLRGMNHSTQRLRGLVMGEVQTTVQRHSLEMKDGLAKRLRTSTSILLGRHLRDLKRDVGQELKTIIHDSVAHAASNISSFVVSSGNPEQKDLVTLENEARDNGITVFTKPHGGSPSDLAALKEAVEDAQSADKLIKGADAPQADGPDATATPGTIMNAGTGETAASGNGISTGAVAVDLDIAGKPRFEYTFHSPRGPEKWGHISEQYKTCAVGNRQSPVDVRFSSYFPKLKNVIVDPSMPSLEVRMPPMPPTKVINNGHSILVDVPGDGDAANKGSLVFNSSSGSGGGGGRHLADFVFHQFHIHVPGEHEVNGKPADMAIHLVFARTSQAPVAAEQANFTTAEARFSIIEVPFDVRPQGESFLDLLVDRLPQPPPLGAKTPQSTVDPQALPLDFQDALFGQKGADVARLASSEFYTYSGSATTPPCHEDVRWFIMKRILGISQSQLQRLAQVLPKTGNARPPQNHRWRSPPAIRTGGMTTEENADADGTAERELEEHALHPGDHGGSATAPGVVSGGAIGASAPANNRSVPMTKPENPRPPSSKEVAVARATPAPAPSRSLLVAPSPTPSPTPRKERPQLDKDTMLLEMMIAVSGVAKGHKTENEVTKTFGEILANVADVPQANVTIELIHTALPKRQRRGLLQQPGEADSETAGGFNVSVTIRVATTDVAKKVFQRVFERVKDGEITGQLKLMGINGIRAYAVEGPAEFEAEMAAERVNPHDSAGGASGSTGEQLSGASGAEAGASARNIVGMSGRSGASGGGPGEHDSGGASGQGGPSGNAEVTEAVQEVDTASKALQSLPESAMPKMERDMLTKALGKISKDAKENTLKPEDLKGEEAQAAENLMETVKQRIATKQKEHDTKIGANATQASRDMDLAKRRKDDDNAERTAYNLMKDAGVPTEAIPKDTREVRIRIVVVLCLSLSSLCCLCT